MGPEEAVVFDTNVLVSAVGWRGPEHELYERCRAGELAISPELLAELERVLRYPRLGFAEEEIEGFISDLLGHATTVSPSRTVVVVEENPDDDRVIECALAAGARRIVSGDKHQACSKSLFCKTEGEVCSESPEDVGKWRNAPSAGRRSVEVPTGGSLYHEERAQRRRSLGLSKKVDDRDYAVGPSVLVDRSVGG